jgi:2-methylisocitrate lyase-like PEP mutase family enzyme
MELSIHETKAEAFRRMHTGPHILVLPNAWDAASAVIFAQAGFGAIATTSGGVAWTLGYPDGQRMSRGEMLDAVARITRAVSVPVSADLEAGYGATPEAVADTMRQAIAIGVCGVNFEDGTEHGDKPLADVAQQVEKIQAIREAAVVSGVPLVINARTDTYLRAVADDAGRFAETVRRAQAYLQAGADCIFVIGLRQGDIIRRLAREIAGPLNILTGPGAPSIPELEKMRVARVSFGSGTTAATLGLLKRMSRELRDSGTYTTLTQSDVTHPEMNRLFERGAVG